MSISESQMFMSMNFLPKFIEAYKTHRCLWKVKSKEYSNKQLKDAAYQELVELVREVAPDCTVDYIKRKIDILRGSFRRETKKVLASKKNRSQVLYKPKLWYYNLLHFLVDEGEIRSCRGFLEEEEGSIEDSDHEDEHQDISISMKDYSDVNGPTTSDVEDFVSTNKRRRTEGSDQKPIYFETSVPFLEQKIDELESFGKSVAAQLQNMDPMQNIYCQNVINQVLFQGKLNRMQEDSSVFHPASQTSSRPSSKRPLDPSLW